MRTEASLEAVRAADLVDEFKRVWAQKDHEATVRVLQGLAPLCEYRGQELARTLGITFRHVQRIFAVTLGRSPQEWLNQERLLAARELLLDGRRIKEVAYGLGFRAASQFSRDFKGYFGVPPSLFRVERRRAYEVFGERAVE